MGAKKKIAVFLIVTIIALAGVAGYIGFSFTDSKVNVGTSTITDNITEGGTIADPTYSGDITVEQVIYIYNSGQLDIKNLQVNVQVFFSGELDPTEVEVGQGDNDLGTVAAGANESKTIVVKLTNRIARLAVEDGTFRIVIKSSLQLQYIPYTVELPVQESTESWNAPYGDVLP